METTAKRGGAAASGAPRLRGPLLGSAAGHLVLLAAGLLLGAAAGPGAGSVVQVILVEGAQFALSGVVGSVTATPGGAPGASTARHAAAAGPRRLPSSTPADPPAALGASASQSPAAAAEKGATSPGAAPEVPTPGTAKEQETPSPAQPPVPSPMAATPSGGTVFVASARAGEGAGPTVFPAGEGTRASVDGRGASGGAAVGTAARDGPGAPGGGRKEGAAGGGAGTDLLLQKIQSAIVYPPEAIRRGQEGEVLLRIRIADGGVPKEIRVARSSGTRALDEAARRGVVSASPLPSLTGWVEIPVRFFLR